MIENFGKNVCFEPREVLRPENEAQLLAILDERRTGKIRVVAAGHAWSPLIETTETLLDLENFDHVELFETDGQPYVRVGAGCSLKKLLDTLNRSGWTLPSIGLITKQRIAGAISTATHGSGKNSISHYVQAVRLACYSNETEAAEIRVVDQEPDLQAVRCSLGCMGVLTEITFPCVPQYLLQDQAVAYKTIEEILEAEHKFPRQQFYLFPHKWTYFSQDRLTSNRQKRSRLAWLYQIYWFLSIDLGMHIMVLLCASVLRSRRLVHFLFRRILPLCVPRWWRVTDRSDRILTMKHDLFRHLELELFVPGSRVIEASYYLQQVLKFADGQSVELSEQQLDLLRTAQLEESFQELRGTFTHHYPICFRITAPDDALLSMSSGSEEAWYSISLITYTQPREPFQNLATFLAKSMVQLYGARVHWGKWFPLNADEVEQGYPRIEEFRSVCDRYDPRGVFRNAFVERVLFSEPQPDQ